MLFRSDFFQMDPNEIESVTILKDASSTAVFGVRGANGVIIVTTKRGKEGKPKLMLRFLMVFRHLPVCRSSPIVMNMLTL